MKPPALPGVITQVVTCQSPLSELQSELSDAGTQAKVDFVLNVLTDPTICSYSQAGNCPTPTPSSPNLNYQLQMLSTAAGDNIPISFVELGNEFWNSDAYDVDVYDSTTGVYQASYEDSNGPVSDPLTVVSNQTLTKSGASSFILPPYSITRIVSN